MEPVQQVLEVERAVNLLRGFGWEKAVEKVEGDKIVLTFEKTIESPVPPESQA